MTIRLLGISDELRLEIEQNSPGVTTEAARLIIENAVEQAQVAAEQVTAESIKEIQSIIGPHGTISRLQAGGIRIGQAGIGVFLDGVLKTSIDDEGNLFVGSAIDLPATTTFSAFVIDQIYNNESMGEGDLLIGDNSSGVSNIKFDTSVGQLQFRYGQTVTAYMDTDGTVKFLAGTIGGWVIGADSIKDAAGTVGLLSTVTDGDDIRFFAGNTTPASAPFRVTEAGALVASNATITGSITASSGTIGGWTIASDRFYKYSTGTTGIQFNSADASIYVGDLLGTFLWIDGTNKRIRSSNFVTGSTGFQISGDTGDAEFNNLTARGELKTFLLTSSNQMAVAGNIIVSKDAGKLGADVSSGATTVDFGKALTVGNWIKLQGPDSAGNNNLEWMLIGSLVSGTTYNVTRNVDGSGANGWLKDTPFVVIGASGDSRIELVAGASGSIQLITQGAAWNTQTVQASMSTTAGAITAAGGAITMNSIGMTFDNTTGILRFKDSTGAYDGTHGAAIYGETNDGLALVNWKAGKPIWAYIKLTDASTPYLKWYETPSEANTAQLEINAGTSSTRVLIGNDIILRANKDGVETVFNERSNDIDFRIEGDTDANLFKVDAGLDAIGIGGAAESGYKLKVSGKVNLATGNTYDINGSPHAHGGEVVWTQSVSEPGTSFTNFTGASGTWSSDGTVIKQTDTAATKRRAKYNNKVATSLLVYEAEIQIRTAGATRVGGLVIYDGTNTNGIVCYIDQGGSVIALESDSITARNSAAATINTNTWYKVRIVVAAGSVSAYLDGVLKTSAAQVMQDDNIDFIGLISYQAEVWWRNIKMWNLALPA